MQATSHLRPQHVTPENFLVTSHDDHLDADEIEEAVHELLLSKAPPVLVRLIGKGCYQT